VAACASFAPRHARIVSIDKGRGSDAGRRGDLYRADLIRDDIGTILTLSIFKRPDGKP
jgi:carbon-monoxide dehydrogenase large subunit